MTYRFTVPGDPVPKQRARIFSRYGKTWGMTPAKTTEFQSRIALFARNAGVQLTQYPVTLKITVFVRNKAISKKRLNELVISAKRPDLDNYVKSVMDALTGIAYKDDGQVYSLQAQKYYATNGQESRTEIEIESLLF